jgi:hypothetical protein
MSMTLYFQKGGPAGATPRCASQPKTSPLSGGTTSPMFCIVTCVLIAAYGFAGHSTIVGSRLIGAG